MAVQVLIVDDDPGLQTSLGDILRLKGFAPLSARTGKAAIDLLSKHEPHVVLIDLRLEDMPGLDVLRHVRRSAPEVECILLTGNASQSAAIEAVNLGAYSFFQKPFEIEQLLVSIQRAAEKRLAARSLRRSEHRYRGLFEDSPISLWEEDFSAVNERLKLLRRRGVKDFRRYFRSHPAVVAECARLVRVLDVNRATLALFGTQDKDSLIRDLSYFFCDESYTEFQSELVHIAEGRTMFSWEGVNQALDGRRMDVRMTFSAAPGHEGDLARVIVSIIDITEQKQTEARLRQREERFRLMVEHSTDVITMIDAGGQVLYHSPAYSHLTGREAVQRIGGGVFDHIHPDDIESLRHTFSELNSNPHHTLSFEGRLRHADGYYFWVEGTATNLLSDPAVNAIVINYRDITSRRQDEEKLRLAESRLRLLVENIPAIVYTESAQDNRLLFISPQVEALSGYPVARWLEEPGFWFSIIHPQDQAYVDALNKQTYLSGEPFLAEYRLLTRDGHILWAREEATLIRDEHGTPLFWQGVMHDITAARQAGELLRLSEERYRMLTENMTDTIWLMDMNLKTLYISPSVTRLRGFTLEELNALPLDQQMPSESLARAMQIFMEVLSPENLARPDQPSNYTIELEFFKKDGSRFWSENTFVLIRDASGVPVNILGSGQDITARKHAQELVQQRVRELEILFETGLTLSRLLEPREIARHLLDLLASKLSWHHAVLRLYHPENDHVEVLAVSHPGMTVDQLETERLRLQESAAGLGRGLSGWVIAHGQSVRSGDITSDERYLPTFSQIRSGVYVPIQVGERTIGSIAVESETQDAFSVGDERILTTLANQAGVAFENAKLFNRVEQLLDSERHQRQLSQNLQAALGAGAALTGTLDMNTLMDRLLDNLHQVIAYDSACIMLLNDQKETIQIARARGFERYSDAYQGDVSRIIMDVTATENLRWMLEHKQALVIPDVSAYPAWVQTENTAVIRSWAGAPIIINDEVIAFFSTDKEQVGFFTPDHAALLEVIAGQASLAFQNARLFEQTNRRARRLAALNQVSQKLNQLLDLASIAEVATQTIESLLGWLRGSIWLAGSETAITMLYHSTPGIEGKARQVELARLRSLILRPGQGIIGWVIQHGRSVRSADVRQDPHYVKGVEETISEICVPLIYQGETIGCINFESDLENAFRPDDEQVLITLAGEIAGAIARARLYEQTRRRATELGTLAQVSAALRTAPTRAEMIPIILDQLAAILQVKDAAISSVDPSTGDHRVEHALGRWTRTIGRRVKAGQGLSNLIAASREPYLSANILDDSRFAFRTSFHLPEAVAGVPLLVQDQFLGSLWVGRLAAKKQEAPLPFDQNEVRLLGSVADMTANAIHRASLHEHTLVHAAQMQAVNEIGRSLSETLDLESIFGRLTRAIHNLLPDLSAIFISLYNPSLQVLTCSTTFLDGTFIALRELPPLPMDPGGQKPQERILISGEPLVVDSPPVPRHQERTQPQGDPRLRNVPSLFVPMFSQGVPIGLILLQSKKPHRFTSEDASLLSLVATSAAATIENARLFSETQKRLRYISTLHNIDAAISASVDLHVTFSILLDNVARELGVDAAALATLNPFTQTLEYTSSLGFHIRIVEGLRVRLNEGLAGQAVLQRRLASLHTSDQAGLDLFPEEGFASQFAVPLIAKGQVQGVLQVFHRSPLQPDAEWTSFLATLGGQAAIAMDNARLFDDLQRSNLELRLAYDATIEGWSQAMELRDKETQGHSERVTEMTLRLARLAGLSDSDLVHLRRGVLLHDIGKMGIPDSILLKPGSLTPEEWHIMRQHPVFAYEMLSAISYLRPALDIPYCHHEKWDGSGYPRGLQGEQIPLMARLFAIVDVFDAITSERPYHGAWSRERALAHIQEQSGKHFDPQVVDLFLKMEA